MRCLKPLEAWQLECGKVVFVERGQVRRSLSLPCGQCIHCRLERSRRWAVRCVHESRMHEFSSFVTLTYDDEHLPPSQNQSLVYRDFQLFMKRLRRLKGKVRFYMCGEYGEQFGRPHFHACLFGCFFEDRKFLKSLPSGSNLYTSEVLSRLWTFGYASVGDVTFESAAYVARYCVKKVTGKAAEQHYMVVDGETGEVSWREPEFNRMSLKPGIGGTWFERYGGQVFPRDRVVMNGVEMSPPRYYDNLFKAIDKSTVWDDIEFARYKRALLSQDENTPERLAAIEANTRARLSFKKRVL